MLESRVVLSATYLVSDLGGLPGADSSAAVDINNSGEVVGNSTRTGLVPQSRAVKWDANGTVQDLGTLGGTDAWARAINDSGQITGVALDVDGKQDGFRYDPGVGMFDIGGLGSNAGVYPTDINANGDVVGGSFYFRNAGWLSVHRRRRHRDQYSRDNDGSENHNGDQRQR